MKKRFPNFYSHLIALWLRSYIHSLVGQKFTSRMIHVAKIWVFTCNTMKKTGPEGLQSNVGWKISLEEKAFYKDSIFWGDTKNKLYSWEVLTNVCILSGFHNFQIMYAATPHFLPEEKSVSWTIKGPIFQIRSLFITSENAQKPCICFQTQTRVLYTHKYYCS